MGSLTFSAYLFFRNITKMEICFTIWGWGKLDYFFLAYIEIDSRGE